MLFFLIYRLLYWPDISLFTISLILQNWIHQNQLLTKFTFEMLNFLWSIYIINHNCNINHLFWRHYSFISCDLNFSKFLWVPTGANTTYTATFVLYCILDWIVVENWIRFFHNINNLDLLHQFACWIIS